MARQSASSLCEAPFGAAASVWRAEEDELDCENERAGHGWNLNGRADCRRSLIQSGAMRRTLPILLTVALAGCGGSSNHAASPKPTPGRSTSATAASDLGAGRVDVYAHTHAGMLTAAAKRAPARVYVPNSESDSVDVISQRTFKIIDHFAVGDLPQHVTPSHDMRRLYVDNDRGNSLTPINPVTGHHGKPIPVDDPYNLYFTPDGRRAIVVAEALRRLDFRDPHSMRLRHSLHVDCPGVDHLDFTASGRYLLASCEFSGQMVEVDVARERVVKYVPLRVGAMPQDVKLSPDGRRFYVADMASGGLWMVDAKKMRKTGFLPTGKGAHGLYPDRRATRLFVSNRDEGTISVVSFAKRRVMKKWHLPGGASPDMGGVSADGRILWLSGRYDAEVYAISTRTGRLLHRIPVGLGPHGMAVWPQPGRYSLGHTGNTR